MPKDTSRKNEFAAIAAKKEAYWQEHYPHIDTLMEEEPRVVDNSTGMAVFLSKLEQQQRVGFDLETYSDPEMQAAEIKRMSWDWGKALKPEEAAKMCNLCPHRGAAAWAIFTMGEDEQTWLLDLPKLTGIAAPKPGFNRDSTQRQPCPPELKGLKEWFESKDRAVIYGANLVFDWRFLFALGIYPSRTRVFDVQNAHHLLTAGEPSWEASFRSLKHLTGIHLKLYVPKDEQSGDWGAALTHSKKTYMHGDGVAPLRIGAIQREQILRDRPKSGHGLATITNISMAGIFAFAEMQYVGAPFNDQLGQQQEAKAQDREAQSLKKLEKTASKELYEQEGRRLQFNLMGECEVNFASPAQCVKFFKRLGIPLKADEEGKFSVDADLLKQIDDPSQFILDYLDWKDSITEVKAWKTYRSSVNPVTGRIHASFQQLGTDSGRSSCRSPNLQNPSRKAGIRECVEESLDRELVVMDYSQMEVVIMTAECGCPEMLRVNKEKKDFHYNTAERVLGKPRSEISKEERSLMKPLCFGLLYGMFYESLISYAKSTFNVTFSIEEAKDKSEKFFDAYPGLRRHHQKIRTDVRNVKYPGGWGSEPDPDARIVTRTVSGRKRTMWGGNLALQGVCNQPIQGGGSDIAVLAMGRLRSALDEAALEDCMLVNFVHDELCLSCPAGTGKDALPVLEKVMIEAANAFYPEQNFAVEGSVAQSWSEAK